jgi:hypothetical protein
MAVSPFGPRPCRIRMDALNGRNNRHHDPLLRPFRAPNAVFFRFPRALPWADMLLPLQGGRNVRNLKTCGCGLRQHLWTHLEVFVDQGWPFGWL